MRDYFKSKVVIIFGYNGLPYKGLQIQRNNANTETIEQELELKLYECGLISNENYGNIHKIAWQRASRTDKGVHALANVISLKIQVAEKFQSDTIEMQEVNKKMCMNKQKIIEALNEVLSENIKVFSIKMVSRAFDCKLQARSRNYEYIAPLSIFQTDQESKEDTLKTLKDLTAHYIGSKKYHNFSHKLKVTFQIKWDDKNAQRNILEFTPELIELCGQTWVIFRIHGQAQNYLSKDLYITKQEK